MHAPPQVSPRKMADDIHRPVETQPMIAGRGKGGKAAKAPAAQCEQVQPSARFLAAVGSMDSASANVGRSPAPPIATPATVAMTTRPACRPIGAVSGNPAAKRPRW